MYTKQGPYQITEKPGTKFYCGCSQTKKAPYCDGSHKGTGLSPYKVVIEEEKTVYICGCGKSNNLPYCDGSH